MSQFKKNRKSYIGIDIICGAFCDAVRTFRLCTDKKHSNWKIGM
jgi:hypothetical protein